MAPSDSGRIERPHVDMSAARAAAQLASAEQALAVTAVDDHPRRAALLAALASAQTLLDPAAARVTAQEAAAAARHAGTPVAHLHALLAEFAVDLSPEALDRRRDLATRAVALLASPLSAAERATLGPAAYFAYLSAATESGDILALDEALSAEQHVADHLTALLDHRFAHWFRCSRATLDGRFTLAERLAGEGHAKALDAGDVDAETVWIAQLAVIRWMQGRISEMEQVFLHTRQADPGEPAWAAAVAWIWVHQGRARAAQGLLSALPEPGAIRRGRNYLATMSLLAEVVAAVGPDHLATDIEDALLPFADRIVTMGLGVTSWGTVARPLALLAQARGDRAAAERWYRAAIDLCSRMGAQPWLARAQVELAAVRAGEGDSREASELAREAGVAARALGLRVIEEQADHVLRQLDSASDHPAPLRNTRPRTDPGAGVPLAARPRVTSPRRDLAPPVTDPQPPRITMLGEFTVIAADGVPVQWKSRRAATLLKVLLARRGASLARESAMGLLWPDEDPSRVRNRLSVAMTTVRRALDPQRCYPADHFLVAAAGMLRLRLDNLVVDVEDFLALAGRALRRDPAAPDPETLLRETVARYTGDVLADEPHATWAEQLREQAHLAFFAVSHALAERVTDRGHHLERVDLYRGIIALDPYDLVAHDSLIDALDALGAAAHGAAARAERRHRRVELGLPPG